MQKRVHTPCLTTVLLTRWALAGIWVLGFPEVSANINSQEWITVPKAVQQYGLCCTPAFLLGVWSFGTRQAERLPSGPSHSRNPGSQVSDELPCLATFHRCCHKLGELSTPCVTTERPLEARTWCPLDCAHCVSLRWFSLHPFTVTTHSRKYNYMLSPASEPPNLVVVLGDPSTHSELIILY